MDSTLIAILVGGLSFAALLYYVFFIRRETDLSGWGTSGLIAMLFVIAPVIIMALWSQSGAESRLNELGFEPHPGFVSSVGIATGTGRNPTWVFSTDAEAQAIMDFYRQHQNRDGWSLAAERQSSLTFTKAHERMTVHVSEGSVIFALQQD